MDQSITVKVQLVNANDNKVSQSGQETNYTYGTANNRINALGDISDTN